jgi:hypothetical protein
VTSEGRVPIINGHYAIERPRSTTANPDVDREEYVGFSPGDEVLVVGEINRGGVTAHTVFGGTTEEFRKVLSLKQRVLIPAERVLGCLLIALALVLVAPWVGSRIRGHALGRQT